MILSNTGAGGTYYVTDRLLRIFNAVACFILMAALPGHYHYFFLLRSSGCLKGPLFTQGHRSVSGPATGQILFFDYMTLMTLNLSLFAVISVLTTHMLLLYWR